MGASEPACSAANVFCDDFTPRQEITRSSSGKVWSRWNPDTKWQKQPALSASLDAQSALNGGPALHLHVDHWGTGTDETYGPFLLNLANDLHAGASSVVSVTFQFVSEGNEAYGWGFACGAGGYRISFNPFDNTVTEQTDAAIDGKKSFVSATSLPADDHAYFSRKWREVALTLYRGTSTLSMVVDQTEIFRGKLHGDTSQDVCQLRLIYFAGADIKWDGYYKNLRVVVDP